MYCEPRFVLNKKYYAMRKIQGCVPEFSSLRVIVFFFFVVCAFDSGLNVGQLLPYINLFC